MSDFIEKAYSNLSRLFNLTSLQAKELCLEAASAAAAFDDVGIVEREASFFQAVVVVDGCAVQIKHAFLVDSDGHAVMFGDVVVSVVDFIIQSKIILESTATAGANADAKYGGFGWSLF